MSYSQQKVNIHLRAGGIWDVVDDQWVFVNVGLPIHHPVKIPQNVKYYVLANYCQRKCEINTNGGELKIVHMRDGELYHIHDDASAAWFMYKAAECNTAPTLYVCVDYPDNGGTSNVEQTQDQDDVEEEDEQDEESHVFEEGEDEQQEEDDADPGVAPDESHVFEMTDTDEDEEAINRGTPVNNSFSQINDFFDMPPTLEPPDSHVTFNLQLPYGRTTRIKKHQTFDTKDEMIYVVGRKFIEQGYEYKTLRSSPSRYTIICRQSECPWRMSAYPVGEPGKMFQIRKLVDEHTCSPTQLNPRHRQANTKILSRIIKHKFTDASRACRPKDIIKDLQEQYGITVGYGQAWRARWSALRMIRSTPEESFTRLPLYLYNLEVQNPGSFTRIKTDSEGRFEKCIAILRPAIRSFTTVLRRVLIIDAAHLKGQFLGTQFLAVAMDGNNSIVPVAFGVGKSETTDEWTWFLEMLRECIGHPQGLVFVSDRAPAIAAGITAVFPAAHHALCCRHLKMNVKTRDANIKHYKYQFWKTCKAYTPFEFDKHMANLRIKSPAGAQLMDDVGWDKWSRAYFPAVRFNLMTSNSAESVNALSRFARRLPIVPVMEYFRDFQQRWYFLRRQKGG